MITLQDVCCALGVNLGIIQENFSDVSLHSERSGPDVLFWASPSAQYTVEDLAYMAWEKGVRVILAWGSNYRCFQNPNCLNQVCIFQNFPKNTVEILANVFYPGRPSSKCAVTGTNGKTSTVSFLSQLWKTSKIPYVSMGTLGIQGNLNFDFSSSYINTADYLTLSCVLHTSAKKKIQHFAYEASSHGLQQLRIPADAVDIGIWTSFSQDHLDYHKTMEAYWSAKFSLGSLCKKAWLVNDTVYRKFMLMDSSSVSYGQNTPSDITFSDLSSSRAGGLRSLEKEFQQSFLSQMQCDVLCYGLGKNTSLWAECFIYKQSCKGAEVLIRIDSYVWRGIIPLVGSFQCENLVAALGAFYLLGGNLDDAFHIIASGSIQTPSGRLEKVCDGPLGGGGIYIDYAHTPDALYQVLRTLKALKPERLGVVFGCGGERDKEKREKMGKIAQENAHWVIITDDNPRYEDPEKILNDIQRGCPNAQRIRCRRTAIEAAISYMKQGDILLIAGKGHEAFQWVRDEKRVFQDNQVVHERMKKLNKDSIIQ
ncbi:UDP-N-acetylmuramoyl-L-alanyl-D-glutamate--2,6-diaminopimelate ligase [Holospora obtusa F1]|uniref:UDP-N-acetylmuramoyl-L-alanyl-D-glutamate--2, 6-diaminopimelate ligase n=1 Tax=Holospora obtusa F1 TaxID=1399147 RepID=W6TDU8_HOLOB|nr:UDP-N-acetylmuramoyl-L-alanyl-D-glutamate--2,6-diaminopimelate ligase [Holospora obtusa]ETZ06971.1 UDP-N-acetylmuramoyl-L-alanyl-D-glutamate--2,6-diaminopimelate ligase [Holospora obtusa F1]